MSDEALSAKEVIQFVSRSDAIAPIWIKDIMKLTGCRYGAALDTWQIGTVPSRLFRIVGIVIHTNYFENDTNWRTIHVVDDGTGCVEINHTEYKKFAEQPRWHAMQEESQRSAQGRPSSHLDAKTTMQPLASPLMEPCHVPLDNWSIGRFTIRVRRATTNILRIVELHKVERLRSVQEEVNHWKQVMRLHETLYRQPFVVPSSLPPPPTDVSLPTPPPPPPPRSDHNRVTQEVAKPSKSVPPVPAIESSTETLLLPHPASIRTADLHFRTFTFYLAYFMRHDVDNVSDTMSQMSSATSSPPTPALGFTFDYLRHVPDLRYLARRILLAEARRMTRDYLVKRRALEPADNNRPRPSSTSKVDLPSLRKPAPLTDEILTKKIGDLFAHALRHLFGQGEIVAATGKSRPMPVEMGNFLRCSLKNYPCCLGQFKLWGPPPPLPPTSTSTRNSWRTGLQDQDGPVDALELVSSEPSEDAEVYFVVTPDLMKDDVLKAMSLLTRRKERGQHGGGSPGDILATLIRMDEKWRKMNEVRVEESLQLLCDAKKVWNYMKDQWVLTL